MKKLGMFDVHFHCLYQWKLYGMITFYIFPSIEFFRDNLNDDIEAHCFDISLSWLFWRITFTKYWGNAYKNRH